MITFITDTRNLIQKFKTGINIPASNMEPSREVTEAVFKALKADKSNQVGVLRISALHKDLRYVRSFAGIAGLGSPHGVQLRSEYTSAWIALVCTAIWAFMSVLSSTSMFGHTLPRIDKQL